jgi:hypothetical protein
MRTAPAGVLLILLTGCGTATSAGVPATFTTNVAAAPTRAPATPPVASVAISAPAVPGPSIDITPVVGTAGPVAWADLPYRALIDPDSTVAPQGEPPWCRTSDLAISESSPTPVIHNSLVDQIVLTFASTPRARKCSLQGVVAAAIHDADDSSIVTGVEPSVWRFLGLPPDTFSVQPVVTVDATHPAYELLAWNHVQCQGDGTFDVRLPHHGGAFSFGWPAQPASAPCSPYVVVPSAWQAVSGNPAWSDHWLTLHPISRRQYGLDSDSPWTQASDVYLVDHTVTAGATLRYRVQVAAFPGNPPQPLTPCWGYQEQLVDATSLRVLASEDHQLNCTGVASITRTGTLFDMQLTVPRTIRPGTVVEVGWQPSRPDIAGANPVNGVTSLMITVTKPTG